MPQATKRNNSNLSSLQVETQIKRSSSAKGPDLRSLPPSYKQFKLISVALKEAALDSPSFRASINHLDLQFSNTEKWLSALTASLMKVPREVKELQGFLNSFMEYLVPLFLQDGLLDQEYTVSSLNNTKDGLKVLWNLALDMIQVNMPNVETVRDDIADEIDSYKQLRKQFDAAQEKYDQFLSLYMALPKLKEAEMIMEDLLQVFAARKEYIRLSLDLSMKISDVSIFINEKLTSLNFLIWKEKLDKFSNNPVVTAMFAEYWSTTKRIKCWSENYHKAMLNLSGDLLVAKKHIEERTISQFSPSILLNDYRTLLINSRTLNDVNEPSAEIYGYLFLKTWSDKSSKAFWVKRWAFIQGGVFGFLVLNPSQSSVQETDKIGLLLCNAKYSPNEDRRFCFEVKTIDTTLVLQAETLAELKSWLKVFENARKRIISENDPMHELFTIASGRYPPLVTEFQSSINTVTDREITSPRIINSAGQIITSSRLSTHLEKNEKLFQNYIYNEIARIYLPFVTDTTRSSLIAYSLTGSTAVPTALSGNVWGSLNWGVYYMNDSDSSDEIYDDDIPDEAFTKQIGIGIKIPKNYPDPWLPREIQLCALFESAVGPLECCLVSFNCLISPSARQELRGTIFFTQKSIYSYIHSLGFVSLSKASIARFVEAKCTKRKNYDMLKVVNVQGSLRAKLFMDDGELIAKKLNCVFINAASDKPVGISELINQILEIENEHKTEKTKLSTPLLDEDAHTAITNPSSFDFLVPSDSLSHKLFRIDFSDEMPLLGEHIVKLPPKALFHVLFGSRSTLIEESYPSVIVKTSERAKWMKNPENEKSLLREFITDYHYYGKKNGKITVKQELDEFYENEYYSCKITRSDFKMIYGPEFKFVARIVLIGIEGGQTKLKYYGHVKTDSNSLLAWAVKQICKSYTQSFLGSIYRSVDEAAVKIGHSGKILKAIYLYGKIEVTDVPYKTTRISPSEIGLGTVIRLFFMGTTTSATRKFFASVYFLSRAFKIVLQSLSTHRILVGIIALLSIMNVILSARSVQNYWNAREARGLVRDVISFEPMMMERAIYLKDIRDLIRRNEFFASESSCFKTFQNLSFVLNFERPSAWSNAYQEELTRNAAIKLRNSLQDIGIRRNELLVNLRMLNALEEEIARAEWKNWLFNELEKCDQLKNLPIVDDQDILDKEFKSGLDVLDEFCSSCAQEMDLLIVNTHL